MNKRGHKDQPDKLIVAKPSASKGSRWAIYRESNAWDRRTNRHWRKRRRLVTGGRHDTWECALSWAKSHVDRLASQGYKVPVVKVEHRVE